MKVKWIKEQVGEENESEGDQETTQEESRQAGEEYVLLCQSVRRRAKEEAIYSGAEERFMKALEGLQKRGRSRPFKGARKNPYRDRALTGATFPSAALLFY